MGRLFWANGQASLLGTYCASGQCVSFKGVFTPYALKLIFKLQ